MAAASKKANSKGGSKGSSLGNYGQRAAIPSRGNFSLGRWFSDHLDSALDSIGRFLLSPLQSFMTLAVIAVALSLPSMLYMLVKSVDIGINRVHQSADISVYFKPGTAESTSLQVQAQILGMQGVNAARFMSPEKALEEFQEYSGLGDALSFLNENPLPATLLVTPDIEQSDIEGMVSTISQYESVDQVQFDYLWLQRLQALIAVVEQLVIALAGLLAIGVILILGNTIRLEIESRRDEVVVIKLVGGTDAYVRRPLLYTGLWYGLTGALLAWFITNFFAALLTSPLRHLGELYFSEVSLVGLDSAELGIMLLIGLFLGLIGAWLAAARHLASIEPT